MTTKKPPLIPAPMAVEKHAPEPPPRPNPTPVPVPVPAGTPISGMAMSTSPGGAPSAVSVNDVSADLEKIVKKAQDYAGIYERTPPHTPWEGLIFARAVLTLAGQIDALIENILQSSLDDDEIRELFDDSGMSDVVFHPEDRPQEGEEEVGEDDSDEICQG